MNFREFRNITSYTIIFGFPYRIYLAEVSAQATSLVVTAQATALHRAYPWSILQLSPSQRTALQSALKLHGLELPGAQGF